MAVRTSAKGISKMEAVRSALREMGNDAMPVKIQEFVKSKFGLEMTPSYASTYKSIIARKSKKLAAAKEPEVVATELAPMKPASVKAGNGAALSLQDIENVKELIERVGDKSLKDLIGILQG